MDDSPDIPVREGYAAWASFYDSDGNPLTALEEPVIRGWFGPIQGRRALDLGSGTGQLTLALLNEGASVAALDDSEEMMHRARAKLRGCPVDWVKHRLPAPLPFADSTFDLVVLGLVAEHVEDLAAVLAEAARVARFDAHCLISALHPDRTAQGQRARFIDPETGLRRHIATIHRPIETYLAIARDAGWSLVEESTLVVPEEMADSLPRARPYVGQALGWVARWRKA